MVLAMLSMFAVMLAFMRRRRNRSREKDKGPEEGAEAVHTRVGEFGKRGTVLVGRGLESSHGLPRSGGWLDSRPSPLLSMNTSAARSSSVPSSPSSSADSRGATLNPA